MIVFLSCVKLKRNSPCKARNMYISDLFQKSLAYAMQLNPRNIYILSAKYGLLGLDDYIEPYNQTLNDMHEEERKRWAYKVCRQCESKGISYDEEAIFLCGNNYRKYLMQKFNKSSAPLGDMRIGEQLKFYKNNVNRK